MSDFDEIPRDWLRTRCAAMIQSFSLPDKVRGFLLQDVEAGEYAIAVDALCGYLYENDVQIDQARFDSLRELCVDLDIEDETINAVAECCLE